MCHGDIIQRRLQDRRIRQVAGSLGHETRDGGEGGVVPGHQPVHTFGEQQVVQGIIGVIHPFDALEQDLAHRLVVVEERSLAQHSVPRQVLPVPLQPLGKPSIVVPVFQESIQQGFAVDDLHHVVGSLDRPFFGPLRLDVDDQREELAERIDEAVHRRLVQRVGIMQVALEVRAQHDGRGHSVLQSVDHPERRACPHGRKVDAHVRIPFHALGVQVGGTKHRGRDCMLDGRSQDELSFVLLFLVLVPVCSSLLKVNDSFRKIIVQKDDIVSWNDDNGILHVSIEQFLLDNYILN